MKMKRRQMIADVPAVAMGDIAFNLLIFFVILAKSQDDTHLQWQPATGDRLQEVGHARATIVIDKNHGLYLNGQPIGISQLEAALNERLGNAPAEERKVQFKIDRQAMASRFEPVFEAASRAGAKIYQILEEEKEKE